VILNAIAFFRTIRRAYDKLINNEYLENSNDTGALETMNVDNDRRIVVFIGHFGSGKTECAVNYALKIRENSDCKVALVDLDIANPFFRSREKKSMMEARGVENISNLYGNMITDEIPALDPSIRRPLENKKYRAVVDAGGDPSGAKLLVQFGDLMQQDDCDVFAVINANRPVTSGAGNTVTLLRNIEMTSGLEITGLVNNTHMLRETRVDDIIKGNRLAVEIGGVMDLPVKYNTCEEHLLDELSAYCQTEKMEGEIFPIHLEMRDSWLDRKV